jgi:regulator of protease activity HflC (stomatin/prohibitin superfamily)
MDDAELPVRRRGQLNELMLRLREPRERRRRGIISNIVVSGATQIFRVKFWLTKMLLRSYIRLGATMYQRSANALILRREASVVVYPEPELLVAQRRLQRFVSRVLAAKLSFALLVAILTFSYTNPYTPPGSEGYVYEQPRILGAGGFKGAQIGPANFGISFWRNKVINIDTRPDAHDEAFEALTLDDLAISLHLTAVLWISPGHVVQVVNDYGGEEWYARFIRPRLRSLVQDAVQRRTSSELKSQRSAVEEEVRAGLQAYLTGTPFMLRDLSTTDLAYPERIAQAVQRKLEARQLLEEKDTQVEIARRDAEIEVVGAQGRSEAQRLLGSTLTPMFLQHEAIEAEAKAAASGARTTVYVPTAAGGVPLIDSSGLSPKPVRTGSPD